MRGTKASVATYTEACAEAGKGADGKHGCEAAVRPLHSHVYHVRMHGSSRELNVFDVHPSERALRTSELRWWSDVVPVRVGGKGRRDTDLDDEAEESQGCSSGSKNTERGRGLAKCERTLGHNERI